MRILKSIIVALVALVVLTALSHYALDGSISPAMAGFGGYLAGQITWWLTPRKDASRRAKWADQHDPKK
jgi:lipopolysaccharide export LptBFGC system permease protein LptF